jgi:hypothetical protein
MSIAGAILQIVSPEGVLTTPNPIEPASGLDDLHARHVAFLSNTKPNIDLLLQTYSQLLREHYQTSGTQQRKLNAAIGAGALVDELAIRSDAAVTGIADCGACTAQTTRDAVAFEARGIPTVVITTTAFEPLVIHQARYSGARRIRMLVFPHPFDTLRSEEVIERAKSSIDEVVGLLSTNAAREIAG